MTGESTLRVKLLRPGARLPDRATPGASGFDLYACLDGNPMYAHHRDRRDPFYSHFVIYSPDVPVFRTDAGDLLEHREDLVVAHALVEVRLDCAVPLVQRTRRVVGDSPLDPVEGGVVEMPLAHLHPEDPLA